MSELEEAIYFCAIIAAFFLIVTGIVIGVFSTLILEWIF